MNYSFLIATFSEIYNNQQHGIGKKDGFLKAMGDIDNDLEYDDSITHRNDSYIEGYKQGYEIGWDIYSEE